jgi:hypothetical protein
MLKGNAGQRYLLIFFGSILDITRPESEIRITRYTNQNFVYDVVSEEDDRFATILQLVANMKSVMELSGVPGFMKRLLDSWKSHQDLTKSVFCPITCLSSRNKGTAVGKIVECSPHPSFNICFVYEPL